MDGATNRNDTLAVVLRGWVAAESDRKHLVLLENDRVVAALSFGELLVGAEAVARGLRWHGIARQQTVALMLPTSCEFFFGFMGTLLAGAVPVPIYPPLKIDQIEEYAERQVRILRNAQVTALLTAKRATKLARLLRPNVPSLRAVLRTEKLLEEEGTGVPVECPELSVNSEDLALIQYTSGSTGDPKGVTLTHGNLSANIRAIAQAVRVGPDDVVVSWLPLYHDMGLIGCWLFALYHGLQMVCFSPLEFLRQPKRWLPGHAS